MTAYSLLTARAPGRKWSELAWYETARRGCALVGAAGFRLQVNGRENIPLSGPVIFASNHQSFLDPGLCGAATGWRPSRPMARESLFRVPLLGTLLRTLGTVPVNMEGGAVAALRCAMTELEAGRAVTLFPEGTRSRDGELGEFRPGLALLVRRCRAPVVPMAIDGSFEAWPRHRRLPRLGVPVVVEIGTPILASVDQPGDAVSKDIVTQVHAAVRVLLAQARTRRAIMCA